MPGRPGREGGQQSRRVGDGAEHTALHRQILHAGRYCLRQFFRRLLAARSQFFCRFPVNRLGFGFTVTQCFGIAAGAEFGMVHAGLKALASLRMEKGYRDYGHDIDNTDDPLSAGFGFAIAWDKPGGFIGREALLKQKEEGLKQKLVQFLLKSPEPMLYHNEPIWQGDRIAGYIRSGMYAQMLGGACGLGYVTAADGGGVGPIGADDFEIEIAGVRYPATASLKPMYDPTNARIKI